MKYASVTKKSILHLKITLTDFIDFEIIFLQFLTLLKLSSNIVI